MGLRENWREKFGPLDLPMPADPDPCPGVNWQQRFDDGLLTLHQDYDDRLNSNRTWGADPWEYGGSGIAFGYSQPDFEAVRVACLAFDTMQESQLPDHEHIIRQLMYPMAGFEMTHEVYFARRVQRVAQRSDQWYSLVGPVQTNWDVGLWPYNLANLHHYVEEHPRQGIPHNIRQLGWAMYTKAMEHKCARILGAPVDPTWMQVAVDICERAAIPGTGQVCADLEHGGVEYQFHWGILAMGAMACCYRLHKPIPVWVLEKLDALEALAPSYGGVIPSYVLSVDGALAVADIAGQKSDPAQAYWSSVCVAARKMTGDASLLERATRFGVSAWDGHDEQTRRDTMLLRGAQGG